MAEPDESGVYLPGLPDLGETGLVIYTAGYFKQIKGIGYTAWAWFYDDPDEQAMVKHAELHAWGDAWGYPSERMAELEAIDRAIVETADAQKRFNEVTIRCQSELIVRSLLGTWDVRSPVVKEKIQQIQSRLQGKELILELISAKANIMCLSLCDKVIQERASEYPF